LGHDLLELLLLVSEAVLLLILALAVVVPVGIIILVGGVELLPLGAVGDKVGGSTTLEAAPGCSPPLLTEFV
jgi:type IV secretory pathway TrbL component